MSEIEFWFDFGSAYAYFASLEIEDLAARHSRRVAWRPFMLGTAFKLTGAKGLSSTPLKKDYSRLDWERIARLRGCRSSCRRITRRWRWRRRARSMQSSGKIPRLLDDWFTDCSRPAMSTGSTPAGSRTFWG